MEMIKTGTAKMVDDAIEKKAEGKESRNYMGVSGIGKDCSRQLWYSFHTPKQITDPRVNRIFQMGHVLEDMVVGWLRDAGLQVFTEMEDGEQFGFTDGDVAGHIDGVVMGLPESTKPHLLEVKSANSKRFKTFQDKGYKSDTTYWTQIQIYMLKMNLERSLVVIINKDNCELYFERVNFDKKFAERKLSRGKEIAKLVNDPPVRPYSKSTFYKCRWCDFNKECWEGVEE